MTMASSAPAANRDQFKNKVEYYLTALSYAVGLGNVWRFPYLCYRNGGGSFFVPYLLSLFFLGLTFFFFESTIGQFSSLGPIKVWRISPVFKGIGYAMFMMGTYVGIYYNMVIAWAIYYVYASFTSLPEVPWLHCNNTWNTERCFMEVVDRSGNGSAVAPVIFGPNNVSLPTLSPSHEFFYNQVLEKSEDISDMGPIRGHLVLCLALAWLLVFLGLCLGAKSLGKVSYFTAIFPYIMITALLVKGVQLDGAWNGILHYIKPEFEKLTTISVWADAATQIFFSLSICMGGVITLASYNPYHNNTFRDSAIIVICNSLTSIYAGFAIFSVIGFMADQTGKLVEEAADQGVGLAFVAYPAALARLPVSPFWSVVFFFMIITLGFGSQMTIVETVVSTIVDFWPSKLQTRKPYVLAATCFFLFLCGLPMCTGSGIYILQLMDAYAVPYSAFFIGFFEVIAIAWVYGLDRHFENIRKMMGYVIWPKLYWHIIFKYGCPVIIVVILGMVISDFKELTYNEYIFPQYTNYIGWAMSMSSVLMIPIFAIYEFSKVVIGKRSLKDILRPDVTFNNNNNNDDCDSDDVNFDNKLSTNLDKTFLRNGVKGMNHTEEGEINHAFVTSEKIQISNGHAKHSNPQLISYTSNWEREQMQHAPPNLAIATNGFSAINRLESNSAQSDKNNSINNKTIEAI